MPQFAMPLDTRVIVKAHPPPLRTTTLLLGVKLQFRLWANWHLAYKRESHSLERLDQIVSKHYAHGVPLAIKGGRRDTRRRPHARCA